MKIISNLDSTDIALQLVSELQSHLNPPNPQTNRDIRQTIYDAFRINNSSNYLIGDFQNIIAKSTDYKPQIIDSIFGDIALLLKDSPLFYYIYSPPILNCVWQICSTLKIEDRHLYIASIEGSGTSAAIEIASILCKAVIIYPIIRRFADINEIKAELTKIAIQCTLSNKITAIVIPYDAYQSEIVYQVSSHWISLLKFGNLPIELQNELIHQNIDLSKCLEVLKSKLHFIVVNGLGSFKMCERMELTSITTDEVATILDHFFVNKSIGSTQRELIVSSLSKYFTKTDKPNVLSPYTVKINYEVFFNRERLIEFIIGAQNIEKTL